MSVWGEGVSKQTATTAERQNPDSPEGPSSLVGLASLEVLVVPGGERGGRERWQWKVSYTLSKRLDIKLYPLKKIHTHTHIHTHIHTNTTLSLHFHTLRSLSDHKDWLHSEANFLWVHNERWQNETERH